MNHRPLGWLVLLLAGCAHAPASPASRSSTALSFADGEAVLGALHAPADVARVCDESEHHLGALRDAALAPSLDGPAFVCATQRLDRAAIVAIAVSDLIGQVHGDEAVRDAARACNAKLVALVGAAERGPLLARMAPLSSLTGADARYRERFLADARPGGVELPRDRAAALQTLRAREADLTGRMTEALARPIAPILVEKQRLGGLPADLVASFPVDQQGRVAIDPRSGWFPIASLAEDRALAAELLAKRRAAVVPGNVQLLDELLAVRREIARTLGCESYVACEARTRMVRTPARTEKFLDELIAAIERVSPPYRAAIGLRPDERMPEVDLPRREELLRDRVGLGIPTRWLAWFEVDATLDRMLAALGDAIGLGFVATQAPTWSPEVRVFDVRDGSGRRIGRFYFDLYLRPGKVSGSGSSWPFVPHTPGATDAPVSVAISTTIPRAAGDGPTHIPDSGYLSLLLHETGHAIDFLFETMSAFESDEQDFFDVPSQLFERFSLDERFVAQVGRDHAGAPLPPEGAAALVADRRWARFWYARSVALFGLLDLALHGASSVEPSRAYCSAHDRLWPTRCDPSEHAEASLFMPTLVYAGNGHALPWGFAISTDLAGAFRHGLADPATWARLFHEVLGVDAPAEHRITRFLGRPFTVDALARELAPPLAQ